jgi:zona occludens toxin (predicted ATPase)
MTRDELLANLKLIQAWHTLDATVWQATIDEAVRVIEAHESAQRDADRWRAFIGSDRVRVWGWAEHGTAHMHFGAEFWITHPAIESLTRERNRELLTTYADAAIAAGKHVGSSDSAASNEEAKQEDPVLEQLAPAHWGTL